jgi:hypothetical protein
MWWSTRRSCAAQTTHDVSVVMPGWGTPSRMRDGDPVVPGIHVFRAANKDVDGRDRPGHDVQSNST